MFTCVISHGHSLLFYYRQLILCQPLDQHCLELIRDTLVFTLTKTYFLDQDGKALAEVKAAALHDFMMQQLSQGLEFEIETAPLQKLIAQAVSHLALQIFDEYCGQQLYIHSLHQRLSHVAHHARDGPLDIKEEFL